jgi:hypothetical protein
MVSPRHLPHCLSRTPDHFSPLLTPLQLSSFRFHFVDFFREVYTCEAGRLCAQAGGRAWDGRSLIKESLLCGGCAVANGGAASAADDAAIGAPLLMARVSDVSLPRCEPSLAWVPDLLRARCSFAKFVFTGLPRECAAALASDGWDETQDGLFTTRFPGFPDR